MINIKPTNEPLFVLSLFDGMSCGQLALKRAKIPVAQYFASEIDPYAIHETQRNFPKTIQLGDVRKVKAKKLPKIDLLIGGSPCQGFSIAGHQLNFKDPRSKLFFEFVRILNEVREYNPNVLFMLENVPMKQEFEDIITKKIGVKPIEINSNLVSAQNRKRLYWTNIPNITQPKDKGIMLKDIVHENVDLKASAIAENGKTYALTATYDGAIPSNSFERKQRTMLFEELNRFKVPFDKTLQIINREVEKGKIGYFRKDIQANRVYYINGKAVSITGNSGGGAAKMGQYLFGVITPSKSNTRQIKRINDGKKFYTLTSEDRHGILIEGYIRKLTPIECERLQTVPDNYTAGVSNSQRYKMLGNGWTIDVIAHIFKHINTQSMPIKAPIKVQDKLSVARAKLSKIRRKAA